MTADGGEDGRSGDPDRSGRLSIGDLADATGLSAHTLRYYEDEGLIPEVGRNSAGHRRYREDHVRWVGLLERLRTSGMSIRRMRNYVALAIHGDETLEQRKRLLELHEADIEARIAELTQCLAIVRAKIDLYEGRLEDPTEVWKLVDEAQQQLRGSDWPGIRSHP